MQRRNSIVPHAIESGEIVLKPHREPQRVYAGTVGYEASNGWRIVIFNDANAWDYIEWITASDGTCVDFYDMEYHSDLNKYVPSDEVAWRRCGIPGYLQNRCKKCEAVSMQTIAGYIFVNIAYPMHRFIKSNFIRQKNQHEHRKPYQPRTPSQDRCASR